MQKLEKILKEIDEIKVGFDTECRSECDLYDWSCGACVGECDEYIKERAKEIIRKHMNDGWIPAKEKPAEDGFYVATMSGALVDQEEPFVGLAEFEDGEWVDGDDVIAWRPLPEPYQAERSDNNDGE
ncbi:MAG TPA: hypothetical protein H9695_01170 [Candidatus Mediterraneibacter excrementigallinarum]|nr:hypothetical protein [Candidatus Mediterraneibacter excrementigallinarum]